MHCCSLLQAWRLFAPYRVTSSTSQFPLPPPLKRRRGVTPGGGTTHKTCWRPPGQAWPGVVQKVDGARLGDALPQRAAGLLLELLRRRDLNLRRAHPPVTPPPRAGLHPFFCTIPAGGARVRGTRQAMPVKRLRRWSQQAFPVRPKKRTSQHLVCVVCRYLFCWKGAATPVQTFDDLAPQSPLPSLHPRGRAVGWGSAAPNWKVGFVGPPPQPPRPHT